MDKVTFSTLNLGDCFILREIPFQKIREAGLENKALRVDTGEVFSCKNDELVKPISKAEGVLFIKLPMVLKKIFTDKTKLSIEEFIWGIIIGVIVVAIWHGRSGI